MVARVRRDQLREFWLMLRAGVPPGDASARLGFGSRAGYRWLAQSGGMPPISLQDSKGKPSRLTIAEREEILAGMSREESVREIGRRIGRHHTTVSREIARNLHHQKYPRGSNKRGYVTSGRGVTLRTWRSCGPLGARSGPSRRGWRATFGCAGTCWIGSSTTTVPNRSPADCVRTSPMIRRCGCHTRRSTSRSTSRAVAR